MEIQDLDFNQAKWVLEPELSTLELYVHFYNCVTHDWFCVAIENRTPDLTGKGKEKELEKNPLRALKTLLLKISIPSYQKFQLQVLQSYECLEKTKLLSLSAFCSFYPFCSL